MKRILAIITSLALLLSVVIIPSAFVVNAEETTENEVTVYVSTKGSDDAYVDETTTTYGDGSAEHPYLTLSKAMEVIEADETATSGRIIISEDDNGYAEDGTTEIADGITFTQSAHTKMITIAGIDTTIYLVGAGGTTGTALLGPTTFETMYMKKMGLSPRGHKVVFGQNVKHYGTNELITGFNGTVDGEDIYFDNFSRNDTSSFRTIYIGSSSSTTEYTVNGDVNVRTYGASSYGFYANQFYIRNGTFNGNVNITVDGAINIKGTPKQIRIPDDYAPVFNGAVQILLNDGIARSKVDLASFRTQEPAEGTWIISGEAATDGSRLQTTATAGVFKVNGGMVANAYKIDVTGETAEDGTVTYTETQSETAVQSVNGILDLANAPGEYAVTYTAREAVENEDLTVYVSADGSDVNEGTEEYPFGTIDFAQKWLNLSTATGDKKIIVIDTAEFDGGEPHEDMITIEGAVSTAKLTYKSENIQFATGKNLNVVTLQGPTTFKNIVCPTSNASSNTYLVTAGHKAIFNLPGTGNAEKIFMVGQVTDTPEGTRENVVFDSIGGAYGAYNCITIGAASYTNNVSAGVDLEINAGRLAKIALASGTTYSGNVNIVLNSFNGRNNAASTAFENNAPTINGAFQVIVNNGRISQFSDAAVTNMNAVVAAGGTWIIRCAKDATNGSLLATTDTAGVFAVSGGMVAKAYKVTDGVAAETETAISQNGLLDLSGLENAGVYDVEFSLPEVEENLASTVYVSADGSNENDGTADAPFATIDYAQTVLSESKSTEAKKIIVKGTVDFDGGEPHDEMITIEGYDETAALTYVKSNFKTANSSDNKTGIILQGPTTFDGIYLPGGNIADNCYEVVFQNMSTTKSGTYNYYFTNINEADASKRHKVVIDNLPGKSGASNMLHVTSYYGYKYNAGIDLELNGGRLLQLNFTQTTFTGDVNVVLNSFSRRESGTNVTIGTTGSTFNGAFQFVVNNGRYSYFSDAAKANLSALEAEGGKWVINAQTAADGSLLKLTDTLGKFEFTSEDGLAAYAYDQEGNLVAQSEDGILDLSKNPGVYTVEYADEAYMLPAIYVDATNGSDEYLGSEDKPVATLKAAIEKVLTTAAEDKVIYIMGTVDTLANAATSDYVTYSEMITFKAYDENSAINLVGTWKNRLYDTYLLQGPTTFEDLKFIKPSGDTVEIVTNGNELIINDCYSTDTISIAVGDYQKNETTSSINKLTVNGFKVVDESLSETAWSGLMITYGSFGGSSDTASAGYSTKGIDITLNGARVRYLRAITGYGGTITGDVNITINNCNPTLESSGRTLDTIVGVYDSETETLTQAQTINGAVRVVVNNNIGETIVKGSNENNNLSKITAEGGAYFVYSSDVNGNTMGIGEEAGTFAINSPYSVDVKDADGNVVKRASDVLSVGAGTYYVSFYNAADINADGKLDIRDLVALKNVFAEETVPNYPQYDISLDGKVEASDLSSFQKYFLNVEDIKFGTVENLNFTYFEDVELLSDTEGITADYENEIYSGTTKMPDTEEIIYVSSRNADGTGDGSEENPYESIEALNAAFADMVKDSDTTQRAVLFERGSVFRTTEALVVDSYTYYGAYGDGDDPKPQILGSLQDYADASLWTSENGGSIWKLQLDTTKLAEGYEAANIVVTKNDVEGIAIAKNELSSVDNTGEYYYDLNTGIVYLYCDYINPAKYFDTIEISTTNILVTNYVRLGDEADTRVANSNFIIDNLSFKYAGKNAMSLVNAKDAQVTYCEIGWIGGHYTDSRADRYGNGIEMWNIAMNITIANNHIYQVYDAAVTYQGDTNNHYEGIAIEANLIQRCSYGFEFWASAGLADGATDEEKKAAYEKQGAYMKDIVFDSNLMQLAAGGMGGACRPTAKYQSFIQPYGFNSSLLPEGSFDVTVSNNIFDTSYRAFVYGVDTTIEAIAFEGNSYYQSISTAPCVVRSIVCEDYDAFEAAIDAIDPDYTEIIWEK